MKAPPNVPPPPTALFLAVGLANALVFLAGLRLLKWVLRRVRAAVEAVAWPAPALDVSPATDGA
jgi:hypothetical protein